MAVHSNKRWELRHEVSRLLNDLLLGTVSSPGSGTFVCAISGWEKGDDRFNEWVEVFDYSGTSSGTSGNPTDWVNSTHTLTFKPAATLTAGDLVELHRHFTVLELNDAINSAIAMVAEEKLIDKHSEAIVLNNLLSNSMFEVDSDLTGWSDSSNAPATSEQSTDVVTEGGFSAKIISDGTNANWIYQSLTNHEKYQNRQAICRAKLWTAIADRVRLAIYDGVDYTYSDYHDGKEPARFSVSPTIDKEATELTVQLRTEAGSAVTCYWDECWLAIDNLYEYDISTDFLYVTKVEMEGTVRDRFDILIDPRYYTILRETTPRLKFDRHLFGPISGRKLRVTGLQKSAALSSDTATTGINPVFVKYQAAALLHQSRIRGKGVDTEWHENQMKLCQAVADRERAKIRTNIPADSKKVTK